MLIALKYPGSIGKIDPAMIATRWFVSYLIQ